MNYTFNILILFALYILYRGLRIVREDHHRLVIYRMGKFTRVAGPGTVFLIPHIDQAMDVDLNKSIPHWRTLSKEQLDEEIKNGVLSNKILPQTKGSA